MHRPSQLASPVVSRQSSRRPENQGLPACICMNQVRDTNNGSQCRDKRHSRSNLTSFAVWEAAQNEVKTNESQIISRTTLITKPATVNVNETCFFVVRGTCSVITRINKWLPKKRTLIKPTEAVISFVTSFPRSTNPYRYATHKRDIRATALSLMISREGCRCC